MTKSIQKLGIVGANLLGAMLCIEAKKRGIETVLLDDEITNIAASVADKQLIAEVTRQSIERLALRTDAVVFTKYTIPIIPKEMCEAHRFLPSHRGIDFVANRVEQLTYALLAGVPVPAHYYSKNKKEFIEELEELTLPYKIYQLYESGHEVISVESELEKELFLDEIDDVAVEWVVEEQGNYVRKFTISVIKTKDKVYTYPVKEEVQTTEYIDLPAQITKTMTQKITKFAKKLLQEVETEGLFTLEFGMKLNKSIELIHVTPGTSIGDIATVYATDLSIYEQVLNLLEGEVVKDGVLVNPYQVIVAGQGDEKMKPAFPYHRYSFDTYAEKQIEVYIKKVEEK